MREITYKKRHSLKNHRKLVLIHENNDAKDYKTAVRKSFIYKIAMVDRIEEDLGRPTIFIRKTINHVTNMEKFLFRVKGAFYMKHGEKILKVDFCHTLKIAISWKTKIFSPKKSETLT